MLGLFRSSFNLIEFNPSCRLYTRLLKPLHGEEIEGLDFLAMYRTQPLPSPLHKALYTLIYMVKKLRGWIS